MKILYSFNKRGYEAAYWSREIAAASGERFTFIPFNHDRYLDPGLYVRAQLLDNLYYARHPGLLRLYEDLESAVREHRADVLLVDTCPPYHPDYLRKRIPIYKALRIADGPISAYDRDFAYVQAYDHILYHSPAYSADFTMEEKLAHLGARRADFWPLALFDAGFDPSVTADKILEPERDIDVVFVGALHVSKMPLLARVKKALGRRLMLRGLASFKKNVYFNLRHGFPGWMRPLPFDQYVPVYRRSKIGINVHNRGDYTVGSYRLFELPGNGVLQISDGGPYLEAFFKPGEEVVGYSGADDLIDKVRHYLANDGERRRIALNGYRRVVRDHRFKTRMQECGELLARGLPR
jgi:spore maturation protein CgeB